MIATEFYKKRSDGIDLYRTYSTDGLKIQKLQKDFLGNFVETDEVYDEAIDIESAQFVYRETNEKIEEASE